MSSSDASAAARPQPDPSSGALVLRDAAVAVVASPASQSWSIEVEAPDRLGDPDRLGPAIEAVVAAAHQRRPVPAFVWESPPAATWCREAAAAGSPVRALLELAGPLPVPGSPGALDVRGFRVGPGGDEDAWLAVNNRAFSWHPEQGGWRRADLDAHLVQPWVDLDGFLVHERQGRMAGFCWTKRHDDGRTGEIYVIGVDPDFQGQGLGRALTVAGFDWLHRRGATLGTLWVEESNTPALALYRDLGLRERGRRTAVRLDPPAIG